MIKTSRENREGCPSTLWRKMKILFLNGLCFLRELTWGSSGRIDPWVEKEWKGIYVIQILIIPLSSQWDNSAETNHMGILIIKNLRPLECCIQGYPRQPGSFLPSDFSVAFQPHGKRNTCKRSKTLPSWSLVKTVLFRQVKTLQEVRPSENCCSSCLEFLFW